MFNNIGRKIKTLAKVLCWLGIIASVISGIAMVLTGVAFNSASVVRGYSATVDAELGGAAAVVGGIVMMVVGSLVSWIGSFCMYGFGQLVENSDIRTRVALQQSDGRRLCRGLKCQNSHPARLLR